jgi:hypothetical protein
LSVASGLLAKGLSVAITTVTLDSSDVMKDFYATTNTTTDRKNAIKSAKFTESGTGKSHFN